MIKNVKIVYKFSLLLTLQLAQVCGVPFPALAKQASTPIASFVPMKIATKGTVYWSQWLSDNEVYICTTGDIGTPPQVGRLRIMEHSFACLPALTRYWQEVMEQGISGWKLSRDGSRIHGRDNNGLIMDDTGHILARSQENDDHVFWLDSTHYISYDSHQDIKQSRITETNEIKTEFLTRVKAPISVVGIGKTDSLYVVSPRFNDELLSTPKIAELHVGNDPSLKFKDIEIPNILCTLDGAVSRSNNQIVWLVRIPGPKRANYSEDLVELWITGIDGKNPKRVYRFNDYFKDRTGYILSRNQIHQPDFQLQWLPSGSAVSLVLLGQFLILKVE